MPLLPIMGIQSQLVSSLYWSLRLMRSPLPSQGARPRDIGKLYQETHEARRYPKSFPGVASCYAIQAGRELRVIVKPEKVNEDQAVILAHDICRIEKELQYPGQVKVVVIRETRATDIAK